MIRSDAQTCRALRVLLACVNLDGLWNNEGPTDRAVELLEAGSTALSPEQQTIFRAAWAIWSRSGSLPFAEVLRLDPAHLEALCSLVVALTRDGATVESWIQSSDARAIRTPGGHCSRAACAGPPHHAAPREHSDRRGCVCPCGDCVQARSTEDHLARKATRETTRIKR